jgi:HSP90 family molecular chaperone
MTKRVLKWLDTEAKKDPKKFNDFFLDYGQFIKEGACTDAMHKRDIAKLLRFESSKTTGGDMISLEQYNQRSQEGQKRIYYLLTPKRKYAEESPYTEMFNKKGIEILYLYDTVDEFVVNHLGKFQDYELVSADSPDLADDPLLQDDRSSAAMLGDALSDSDAKNLAGWIEKSLGDEVVKQVDVSRRLASYPAIGKRVQYIYFIYILILFP